MNRFNKSRKAVKNNNATNSLAIKKHATITENDVKNIPAEELLELGLNYLTQAIKSWETALDSIESAAYMQSQTLALPVNLHKLMLHYCF